MSSLILSRNILMRTLLSKPISLARGIVVHLHRFNECYQQNTNSMSLVTHCSFSTGNNLTLRKTSSQSLLDTGSRHGYISIPVRCLHPVGSITVSVPTLPESILTGRVRFIRKIGDRVSVDETIAEIETDQIDLEVHAPESGTIESMLVADGETVTYMTEIIRIALNDHDIDSTTSPTSSTSTIDKEFNS